MEYLYLLAGLVLILAGANYLTDGSVALAERFRVPGFLIGLTIVAVGTSTPELVVSFLSALEGEGDMAGSDEDSWLSQFNASGAFESVDCQIAGLGEVPSIQKLYVAHTKAAIDSLNG